MARRHGKNRRRKKRRGLYAVLIAVIICAAVIFCGTAAADLPGRFSDGTYLTDTEDGVYTVENESAAEEADDIQTSQTDYAAVSAQEAFTLEDVVIPDYEEDEIIEVNGGETFFEEEDLLTEYGITLSEQDALGRSGSAVMCADEADVAQGERGDISEITPTGWHWNSIYDRSHLLMWKLSGCDDERNLITGTSAFNTESMLLYETKVLEFLYEYEDMHVMYRVTPLFEDDELVARGVLMEAYSVEDDGAGLEFCVFCYNVEDGYEIDYLTGAYTALQ